MKTIIFTFIGLLASFWLIIILLTPNYFLLLSAISKPDSAAWYDDRVIEFGLKLIPNKVLMLGFNMKEDTCYATGMLDGINYVNMLVDIRYENFPDTGLIFDKELAKRKAIHFIEQGCDPNDVHPESKLGPIHTAFVAAPKDPEFVLELIDHGANPNLQYPPDMAFDLGGKPAITIVKRLAFDGKPQNRPIYKDLLERLEN